jgi:hypothetical protein
MGSIDHPRHGLKRGERLKAGWSPASFFNGFSFRGCLICFSSFSDTSRKFPPPRVGYETMTPKEKDAFVAVNERSHDNFLKTYHVMLEALAIRWRHVDEIKVNPGVVIDGPLAMLLPAESLDLAEIVMASFRGVLCNGFHSSSLISANRLLAEFSAEFRASIAGPREFERRSMLTVDRLF